MFYNVDTELNSHGDESMDDLPLACLHTHAGVSIRKGGGGGVSRALSFTGGARSRSRSYWRTA